MMIMFPPCKTTNTYCGESRRRRIRTTTLCGKISKSWRVEFPAWVRGNHWSNPPLNPSLNQTRKGFGFGLKEGLKRGLNLPLRGGFKGGFKPPFETPLV